MSHVNLMAILHSLSDGDWHNYDELLSSLRINRETLLSILSFFKEYGFVDLDKECAKLDSSYMKL